MIYNNIFSFYQDLLIKYHLIKSNGSGDTNEESKFFQKFLGAGRALN
jgi:hypothetical protein